MSLAIPKFIPYNDFEKIQFCVASVTGFVPQQESNICKMQLTSANDTKKEASILNDESIKKIVNSSILTIANLDKTHPELYPVGFRSQTGNFVFLTTGNERVADGSSISISGKTNPGLISREQLAKAHFCMGKVTGITPFKGDSRDERVNSLFLSVDFGPLGTKQATLPDTNPKNLLEGKHIAAIMNIQPECVHDTPIDFLCFQDALKRNIPFVLSDSCEEMSAQLCIEPVASERK